MLEGLLVDLVPYNEKFRKLTPQWENGPAGFWGSSGDRPLITKAYFERQYREWLESNKPESGLSFGIQTKDGTPIGEMGFNWISHYHRIGNLGGIIGDTAYWSRGYGTDALLLVIDYAFDWLDLRKVWLNTMSINARVIRQMEKVGFTLEARPRSIMIADGVWHDELIYGLKRDEWPGRLKVIETLGLRPES